MTLNEIQNFKNAESIAAATSKVGGKCDRSTLVNMPEHLEGEICALKTLLPSFNIWAQIHKGQVAFHYTQYTSQIPCYLTVYKFIYYLIYQHNRQQYTINFESQP